MLHQVKKSSLQAVSHVMLLQVLVLQVELDQTLATFGDRNRVAGFMDLTEENVKNWINDPESHKPGNLMPQPEEINNGEKFR